MNSHITILKHPLIEHKLAILRNKDTSNQLFRATLNELSYLLVYEITRDLALQPVQIQTPLATCTARQLAEQILLIPILRAGLGMMDGILDLIPTARVGHIGVYRDEKLFNPSNTTANFRRAPKKCAPSSLTPCSPPAAPSFMSPHSSKSVG